MRYVLLPFLCIDSMLWYLFVSFSLFAMKFLVRVFLCIIVSSVISLLMNDAYGYVQYDYTDGSVVIDFDTNLAGVSSIEGSLIHDAADGYIAPTGNGQSGAVVFSPISPY